MPRGISQPPAPNTQPARRTRGGRSRRGRYGQPPPFVWSTLRPVYHTPGCLWARRIAAENRAEGELRAAEDNGARRYCEICRRRDPLP
jgi:hypothetical protein